MVEFWISLHNHFQVSSAILEFYSASWTKMTSVTRVTLLFVLDRVITHQVCYSMHVLKYITFFFSYKPSFCFFHCSLVFFLQPCLSAFLLLWVCIVVLCFLWTELPLLRGEYCIQFLLQLLLASCLLSPCLFWFYCFSDTLFPFIPQKQTIVWFMDKAGSIR